MIIDGKDIAENIKRELKARVESFAIRPVLTIISIAPNFATEKYLGIKRKVAVSIGVTLNEIALPEDTSTEELIKTIEEQIKKSDGIVLQLPYPNHVDVERALAILPEHLDVDCIGKEAVNAYREGRAHVHPPVVSAIAHIRRMHDVAFEGKKIVVVGQGRLVGKPAALWAARKGAEVITLVKESTDMREVIKSADVLILGAGVLGLVKGDMVKDNVVIFDAGASEDAGRLGGDADAGCRDKASLFTPVPGGLGPIAVAKLFENLITLSSRE